jgi:hypothetical protein
MDNASDSTSPWKADDALMPRLIGMIALEKYPPVPIASGLRTVSLRVAVRSVFLFLWPQKARRKNDLGPKVLIWL